jgi:hypothetical protein
MVSISSDMSAWGLVAGLTTQRGDQVNEMEACMSIVEREVERETPTGAALSNVTKDEPMEREDSWDGCFVPSVPT